MSCSCNTLYLWSSLLFHCSLASMSFSLLNSWRNYVQFAASKKKLASFKRIIANSSCAQNNVIQHKKRRALQKEQSTKLLDGDFGELNWSIHCRKDIGRKLTRERKQKNRTEKWKGAQCCKWGIACILYILPCTFYLSSDRWRRRENGNYGGAVHYFDINIGLSVNNIGSKSSENHGCWQMGTLPSACDFDGCLFEASKSPSEAEWWPGAALL